jgi:hypothetical protein
MHSVVKNPYYPGQKHYFALPPRDAAIAAFAIYTMGNHREAQWESLYGRELRGLFDGSFLCGNWHAEAL